MPIVYDSGTGIISVTYAIGDVRGDSWDNPWTLEDLVAAVPEIQKSGQYHLFDNISIKADSGIPHLEILSAIIEFRGTPKISGGYHLSGCVNTSNASDTRGVRIGREGSHGCAIIMNSSSTGSYVRVDGFYNSVFYGRGYPLESGLSGPRHNLQTKEFVNSRLNGGGANNLSNRMRRCESSVISESLYGWRLSSCDLINNVQIINCNTYGLWVYRVVNVIARNLIVRDTTLTDVDITGFANDIMTAEFTGCVFGNYNVRRIGTATADCYTQVYFKEEFKVITTNQDGDVVQASIKLYDKDDNLIFDTVTDISGEYETEIVRRFHRVERTSPSFTDVTILIDYSPFKLVVNKEGYQDLEIPGITVTPGQPTIIRGALREPEYVEVPVYYQKDIYGSIEESKIICEVKPVSIKGVVK
jgi:hypothetical protein